MIFAIMRLCSSVVVFINFYWVYVQLQQTLSARDVSFFIYLSLFSRLKKTTMFASLRLVLQLYRSRLQCGAWRRGVLALRLVLAGLLQRDRRARPCPWAASCQAPGERRPTCDCCSAPPSLLWVAHLLAICDAGLCSSVLCGGVFIVLMI
jgi:hypothetical protein